MVFRPAPATYRCGDRGRFSPQKVRKKSAKAQHLPTASNGKTAGQTPKQSNRGRSEPRGMSSSSTTTSRDFIASDPTLCGHEALLVGRV
jgi:hypothetical protein